MSGSARRHGATSSWISNYDIGAINKIHGRIVLAPPRGKARSTESSIEINEPSERDRRTISSAVEWIIMNVRVANVDFCKSWSVSSVDTSDFCKSWSVRVPTNEIRSKSRIKCTNVRSRGKKCSFVTR